MKEQLKDFINRKKFTTTQTDGWGYFKRDKAVWVEDILNFLKSHKENGWVKITKRNPLPKFEEVLAFNKEWIDEDFNPKGVRIGFLGEDGFISTVWNSEHDVYGCVSEEGDDYDSIQEQPDGTTKTWYHRHGEAIEGYLPNLPTHYMRISIDGIKKK